MRNLILTLTLLIGFFGYAQKPKVEALRYKEVTTTERDAFTVPSGEHWKIYNTTTAQFEYWDGDSWEVVSSGGDVYLANSQIFTGLNTFGNTDGSSGVTITNSHNVAGFAGLNLINSNVGMGVLASSSNNTGDAFVANAIGTASGFNYVGQDDSVNTFTVDKTGDVVANSFSGDGSNLTGVGGLDTTANYTVTGDWTFDGGSITLGGSSVSMDGAKIEDLGTPIQPTDASTKAYVDANITSSATLWNDLTADITISDTLTLDNGYINYYEAVNDSITVTIPDDTALGLSATDNYTYSFMRQGSGKVMVDYDTGVTGETVQHVADSTKKVFSLIHKGVDNWVALGDFEYYTPALPISNIYAYTNALSSNNDADSVTDISPYTGVVVTSVSNGDGTYKLGVTADGTNGGRGIYLSFPVTDTETYTITMDIEPNGNNVQIWNWSGEDPWISLSEYTATTSYSKNTGCDSGATTIDFVITNQGASGTFYIDNLLILQD